MLKDLKKIDYFWLFFIFTVIICFGFFLTNSSMGIDDELLDWYYIKFAAVSVGRIGRIAQWVIGYEYIPFFYDFIGVLLYALAIVISAECFMKYIEGFTKKQAVIFSCIAVSFPFAAFLFIFMIVTVHIGVVLLASQTAVYLFCKYIFDNKNIKYLIFSYLCLMFSISLYETGVIYFLISLSFIMLLKKKQIKNYGLTLLFSGITVFSYLFISKILKWIMNIDYDRSEEFVKYDFCSITSFVNSLTGALNELWENYLQTINSDFGSFMVAVSIILFLIILLYLAIRNRSVVTAIIGIVMIFLPLSTFFMTGNGNLFYRVYMPFSYFAGITFALLFNFTVNKKIISSIFIALIVLIVLNQAKEMNRIFYTENLKYKEDLAFARFIMHDLRYNKLEHKPIVFAGKKEQIRLNYNYGIEAPEVTESIFNWDRYISPESEFFVRRGYNFMHLHGLNIIRFSQFSPDTVQKIINEIPKMQRFPNKGYIKDMGDFVIVKIGKSVFDKED